MPLYFPSSTTPTTWTRDPSSILKNPPIAFAGDPKILLANAQFTTATRGALLSSCQLNVRPESKAVRAAWKYSGDILKRNDTAAALDGLRSAVSPVKTSASAYAPLISGAQSIKPTDSTPGVVRMAATMRFCITSNLSPL